jgi:hypothetical protein
MKFMPDPNQENKELWSAPHFMQRMFILSLPRDHPYRICEMERFKPTMRDYVGKTAKGMAELILVPPSVSASRAKPLRSITALDDVLGWPTPEQKTEMEQGFADREAENMLDSIEWRAKCGPAYDFNSPLYQKP